MATATLVPLLEYLGTSYRPDVDYVDGELEQRNVGKWEHARLQMLIAAYFVSHEDEWKIIGSTEQRLQVAATRIRIPDLVILRPGPQPPVLTAPPLLIIEILSPDDTYRSLQTRCSEYRGLGVETVWLIDPETRTGRQIDRTTGQDSWTAAETLTVPGTPIALHLPPLFVRLDA